METIGLSHSGACIIVTATEVEVLTAALNCLDEALNGVPEHLRNSDQFTVKAMLVGMHGIRKRLRKDEREASDAQVRAAHKICR